MTKKEIRTFLREFFFAKPKGKWEAVAWVWNRGIFMAWTGLLNVVVILSTNIALLMALYAFIAFALIFFYIYIAKGR